MIKKTIRSSLVLLTAISCLAACSGNKTPPPSLTAPVFITDQEIASSVQHRINETRGIHGKAIVISSKDGVVTLNGSVRNQRAVERAETAAASVQGVRLVKSNLVISQ